MHSVHSEISRSELRKFGLMFGGLFALFGGVLIPWAWNLDWPLWPWLVGGAFGLSAVLIPVALKPLYKLWMRLGNVLGWVNSRIILSLLFFVVVTPIALVFKLLGKDPLHRRLDPTAASYRQASDGAARESLERPF